MKKHWLLDPGHGGLINGEYVTPGKRSPIWDDGTQYFEGVGNREIAKKLSKLLKLANISHELIVTSEEDVPLDVRCLRANRIYKNKRNSVYLSIHSNGVENRQAHGWEVWTSVGQTHSDKLADEFYLSAKCRWPTESMRSDQTDEDFDKEAHFYVLKNTNCPAVLTENFFHTNERECKKYLMCREGQMQIARMHFDAIIKIENDPNL